jgi:hypothetical protein
MQSKSPKVPQLRMSNGTSNDKIVLVFKYILKSSKTLCWISKVNNLSHTLKTESGSQWPTLNRFSSLWWPTLDGQCDPILEYDINKAREAAVPHGLVQYTGGAFYKTLPRIYFVTKTIPRVYFTKPNITQHRNKIPAFEVVSRVGCLARGCGHVTA